MDERADPADDVTCSVPALDDTIEGLPHLLQFGRSTIQKAQSGLGVVFSRSYAVGSVMLWLGYFMGLVIFYALINWMPLADSALINFIRESTLLRITPSEASIR